MRKDEEDDSAYLPHYSVRQPKAVKIARSRPKKIDNLVDFERDLFDLTLSKFAPTEPAQNIKRNPVRRVHIFEHHGEQNGRMPNVTHAVKNLEDCDRIRTRHLNVNADVHAELRASEHRLQLVRRGVSLSKVLMNDSSKKYQAYEPGKRFDGVNDVMRKMPTKYSGIPPSRRIQFVQSTSSTPPERVDLVSKINIAEPQKAKLKKIRHVTAEVELQRHNEMIQHLNHANERRLRSTKQFFDDIADYGYEVAQRRAKRAAQRSRLRVMCKADWWEDFMKEVSKNPKAPSTDEYIDEETEENNNTEMKITRAEEKFIERLARHPNFTMSEFIDIVYEMDKRQSKMKVKDRCRQWLNWINERCKIIDKTTLKIMLEEKKNLMIVAKS